MQAWEILGAGPIKKKFASFKLARGGGRKTWGEPKEVAH